MWANENENKYYIGKRSLRNTNGCLSKSRIYLWNKFEWNPVKCKLLFERIQNKDHHRIQMIKYLIGVSEGNSHVSFFHNNDLKIHLG